MLSYVCVNLAVWAGVITLTLHEQMLCFQVTLTDVTLHAALHCPLTAWVHAGPMTISLSPWTPTWFCGTRGKSPGMLQPSRRAHVWWMSLTSLSTASSATSPSDPGPTTETRCAYICTYINIQLSK